jgi:formate hydrogenlyase subunit 6/NADH:ubiquinone oxidoreductase subunit I
MKIGAMLGDIVRSLFKSPATVAYPAQAAATPERLRGKLVWDASRCTGCNLCVKDCPADAIQIIILDRKAKRFVMEYDENRCIYCSQCVSSCRFDAVHMSCTEWELAQLKQENFKIYYGSDDDIREYLTGNMANAAAGGN